MILAHIKLIQWHNAIDLECCCKKSYETPDCNYEDLVHCITVFSQQGIVPRSQNQKLCFSWACGLFYLTNPDIFLFITLICKKFRIYWVGQKILSNFPVSQEKPKWTFVQPNILFLSVYIFENNIILFWKWDKIWISVAGQRWLPCQWWLSPGREVRMRKIKSENSLFICII